MTRSFTKYTTHPTYNLSRTASNTTVYPHPSPERKQQPKTILQTIMEYSRYRNALNLLDEVAADRDEDFYAHGLHIFLSDTNEESDSLAPVYESYLERGPQSITQMINVSPDEFETLCLV